MAKRSINRLCIPVTALGLLAAVFTVGLSHATGGAADRVIGQIDFSKSAANFVDGRGFNFPSAFAVDPVGGEAYVADTGNNRVLGWTSAAKFRGNQPADLVIGQPDVYSYWCNQAPGDLSPSPSAPPAQNTLCGPEGVAVDHSGNVYVSDTGNNRVLVYSNPFALLPGQSANFSAVMVLGQGSSGTGFTSDAAATRQTGLSSPEGLTVDRSGNLFVLDRGNNRALEYFDPLGAYNPSTGAGDVVADRLFGQADFNGTQPNQGGPATNATLDTSSYDGPDGVAVDSFGNLYVSDDINDRVVEYNAPFDSIPNDPAAHLVFSGFDSYAVSGIAVDPSNALYISGSFNIYRYDEAANSPSNITPGLTFHPYSSGDVGLATDSSGNLYLTDPGANRVIEYFAPGPASGSTPGFPGDTYPDQVLGQTSFQQIRENFADGRSLNQPGGVAIDRSATPNHIYVADSLNNRVLGWNSLAGFTGNQPADLVVGQDDFSESCCSPSASSLSLSGLNSLGGIAVDRYGNLFVADSDKSRVLEFSDPFASFEQTGTSKGFTAIVVFGQGGNFESYNCNEGTTLLGAPPSAATLCLPTGVAFDPAGNLYVADAGNSRVLEFKPDANGSFGPTPMPTAVFGQGGSYVTQICADGPPASPTSQASPSPTLCASPSPTPHPTPGPDNLCGYDQNTVRLAVATDNSGNLYIADSLNHRVIEFTPATPGNFGSDPVASLVFGQGPSGADFNSNVCGTGAAGLCLPSGVASDLDGNLYVTDEDNNRVLEYDEPTQPPVNVTADRVLGQSDFSARQCNGANPGFSASATTMCEPNGLAIDAQGRLYVADTYNNRVLEYDSPLGAPSPTPSPTATPFPTATPTPVPKGLGFGPNPVDFPNTVYGVTGATSAAVEMHLANADTVPMTPISLEGMSIAGADSEDFAISPLTTCASTVSVLQPGARCTIALTFTPHALGLRTARLKVFDNARNGPQLFHLQGYGVRGTLGLSADTIYFGKVAKGQASASRNLIVTNPNTAVLSIGEVAVLNSLGKPTGQFAKVVDTCANTELAAGGQCTIGVTFIPTHVGPITAHVRILDDARQTRQIVYLQGTGE